MKKILSLTLALILLCGSVSVASAVDMPKVVSQKSTVVNNAAAASTINDDMAYATLYSRLLGADRYDAEGNAFYDVPAIAGNICALSVDNVLETNGQLSFQWQHWDENTNGYIDIAGQTERTYLAVVTEEMLQTPDATDETDTVTLCAGFTYTNDVVIYDTAEEMIQALRDQLVARKHFCAAACPVSVAADYNEPNDLNIFEHTGKPKEGDYLANLTKHAWVSIENVEIDGAFYCVFRIEATYRTTAEQEKLVDIAVAEVLKQIRRDDPYTAVLDIFNYVRTNVAYDHPHYDDLISHFNYDIKQTAYGALIDGTAVCEGFAQLFYRLCLEVGIDAHVISGSLWGEPHAWNIADVDDNGTYYFFDPTNNLGFLGTRDPYDEGESYDRSSRFETEPFISQYPMPKEDYQFSPNYTLNGTTLTICENIPDAFEDPNVNTLKWSGLSTKTVKKIVVAEGVTQLGADSLRSFTEVTEVQLPNSLKTIGDRAFYVCNKLSKINFPENLVSIGEEAFQHCDGLTSVQIPDSVQRIGACAFRWCDDLSEISIGQASQLRELGNEAFAGTAITQIYLPDGIKQLPANLFDNCRVLETVRISENVSAIGEGAFAGCWKLQSFKIPEKVTRIENYTFQDCQVLTNVTLPENITYVGDYAFYNCGSVNNYFPDCLEYIGKKAFRACRKLSGSVRIPAMLSYIGEEAFALTAVSRFRVAEGNTKYTAVDGVLFNQDQTELILFPQYYFNGGFGTYTVPAGTKQIANCAFINQEKMQKLVLPDGLLKIGSQAFAKCINLNTVTMPDSVTTIEASAFNNCSTLKAIKLPACLTELKRGAFSACKILTEITIPSGLETVGEYAFSACTSLKTVTIPDSVKEVGAFAFAFCSALTTVNYTGSASQWEKITIGGDNSYLINATVFYGEENTDIPGDEEENKDPKDPIVSFDGNGVDLSLTPVTVAEGEAYGTLPVPVREGYTFSGWFTAPVEGALITENTIVAVEEDHTLYAGWQVVTASGNFGDGFSWVLHSNGTMVLYGAGNMPDFNPYDDTRTAPWWSYANLRKLKIEGNVTSVGANAFWICETLETVYLPDSVLRIEEGTFNACRGLQEIRLSENLQYIGDYAFRSTSLEEIILPESLREIGPNAFTYCNGLTEVTIPASVEIMGSSVFRECKNLRSVTFFGTPQSIGIAIFQDCLVLQTVKLPDGFQSISTDMFYNCTGLYKIDLPDSVITIGNYAFYNAANLRQITMRGVQQIGSSAFANCMSLESVDISEKLKTIKNLAFAGCVRLQEAVMDSGVQEIGWNAFGGCVSITVLELTENAIHINARAFAGCSSLTEITIPDSIINIGSYAFSDCSGLKTVIISEGVKHIGEGTFSGCIALEEVLYKGTEEQWMEIAIGNGNEELFNAQIVYNYIDFVAGDLDGVEGVTDADAVYLLYHTFVPGLYPVDQDCDFNGDGEVNDSDAVYLLYYTFLPDLYPIS